ncbi:TOMM precursor leader peptide-binding protein [Microtetraspora malaysiensis]|uniref:TOMM precursor leader peptide-binding protein n=1 Tax=Microtetraspora malaysiensis TaxID=161358 RepID=UPI00082D860D|nr:TOMM precursor leader peptide-binding protein [Microtetraspora malaysiensis]
MNANVPAPPLREALAGAGLTVRDGDNLPAGGTAVVPLDSWTLASVTELAARARAAGSTVLPVRCDGGLVLVGPLAGPASTGCLACAERTRLDALPGPVPAGAPQTMGGAVPPQAAGLVAALASDVVAAGTTGVLWALRGEDLEVSAHRVVPFGGCEVCAPVPPDGPRPMIIGCHPVAGSSLREDNPRTETAAQLRDVLVDWRLGPVLRLYRWEARTLPLVSAQLPGSAGLIGTGYGRSEDFAEAERVALFEAVERLTGMRPRGVRPEVYATHADLDPALAVDPARLGLHEPDLEHRPDFFLEPYSPENPIHWVYGWSLTHSRDRLIPEQFVYWDSRVWYEGRKQRMFYDSSNGCGLGSSQAEAVLHGLFEIAERDAFLMAWHARTPLRRIAPPADDPQLGRLIDRLGSMGHDLLLFEATNDFGVPVVLSMTRRRVPDPRLPNTLFAAGASRHPVQAMRSAAAEVYINVRNKADSRIGAFDRDRLLAMLDDPFLVLTLDDHVFMNALDEARDRHDFLLGGGSATPWRELWPEPPPCRDLGGYLEEWVDRLASAGLEVIAADQSEPVTRDGLGLHAVKVIVPGSLPMTFGHVYRRTRNLPRLLEVPARLGRLPGPARYEDLPFHPHPFP